MFVWMRPQVEPTKLISSTSERIPKEFSHSSTSIPGNPTVRLTM